MNINKDIDSPSQPKPVPVLVEFKLTDLNWEMVVLNAAAGELVNSPTKGDDNFYISYPTYRHWVKASNRFVNLVKCLVVNEPFSFPIDEKPVFYHKH